MAGKLIAWLRGRLREWLLDEEDKEPDTLLDCVIDGERVSVRITGVHGYMLWGFHSKGQRLVGEGLACNRAHWRRLWHHFNEGGEIAWEEPEPLDSEDS